MHGNIRTKKLLLPWLGKSCLPKTDETADAFIERTVHEIGRKYRVTVATNDGLEQLTVMSQGALRMSADNLREEIERLSRLEYENYLASQKHPES